MRWHVEKDPSGGSIVVDETGDVIVAHVYGHDPNVCASRAALMAAAPTLLDAIRGLLMSADALWEDKNMGHDWREACEEARIALAQAKGGA